MRALNSLPYRILAQASFLFAIIKRINNIYAYQILSKRNILLNTYVRLHAKVYINALTLFTNTKGEKANKQATAYNAFPSKHKTFVVAYTAITYKLSNSIIAYLYKIEIEDNSRVPTPLSSATIGNIRSRVIAIINDKDNNNKLNLCLCQKLAMLTFTLEIAIAMPKKIGCKKTPATKKAVATLQRLLQSNITINNKELSKNNKDNASICSTIEKTLEVILNTTIKVSFKDIVNLLCKHNARFLGNKDISFTIKENIQYKSAYINSVYNCVNKVELCLTAIDKRIDKANNAYIEEIIRYNNLVLAITTLLLSKIDLLETSALIKTSIIKFNQLIRALLNNSYLLYPATRLPTFANLLDSIIVTPCPKRACYNNANAIGSNCKRYQGTTTNSDACLSLDVLSFTPSNSLSIRYLTKDANIFK